MPLDHFRKSSLHKLIHKVTESVSSPPRSSPKNHGTKSSRDFSSLFRSNKKQQEPQSPPPTPSPNRHGARTPRSPFNSLRSRHVRPPETPPNEMAEGEPDYSSLPLTDRWVHKVWKVRKEAYEEAAKAFEITPDEYDPAFRPFNQDPSLWKGAVADSNVAAQTDGTAAYCAFLKFGGKENAVRSRGHTVTPICEKGLISTRPATKASCIEALLLLIELDVAAPVIEDILPAVSAKQPKVIAAALAVLTTIYHNYGCKTVDPKPVLKVLPKAFGHADKNVRAEATNLAVEFYRWLREAMKPMFWGDLKPTQQTDLEAQFEKIKAEGPAKPERLLRSQQAALARAPPPGAEDEYGEEDAGDEPAEVDAFDLAEPQDVLSKVPANFHDNLASSKWKERKEALEALFAIINVPRIKDGHYDEINRGLAKCMKDANIAVVVQAAQCIEALAKGLRKSYGKYRSIVQAPIMERLKEKKAAVSDALGAALDQVFLATSFTECFEDIQAFLVHKNPQVKEGTLKFLVRCLRTTRDVPSKQEITALVESAKKLLAEGSEGLRSGGAEVLGTIMKIVGERAMNPHLEGLDDIRKTKIKEYFETAEVKAKEKPKPKPAAPAARAPPAGAKKMVKKGTAPAKKPAPAAAPLAAQPTPRAAPAGGKLGVPKPSGISGLKAPQKRMAAPAASPRRVAAPPPEEFYEEEEEEEEVLPASPPPRPRVGVGRGGLAGRSLAKPAAPAAAAPAAISPEPSSGLTAMERAELEEIRATNYRLLKQADDMRHERSKMNSEIQELKNQNAQLIEDHTRDVLSIKAKETQLVRARSDAESAEQTNERLRRELERLKRALSKAEAAQSRVGNGSPALGSPTNDEAGIYRDGPNHAGNQMNRMSFTSNQSEEKENGDAHPHHQARSKMMSPELRVGSGSSGRASPARGFRSASPARNFRSTSIDDHAGNGGNGPAAGANQAAAAAGANGGNGVESWKRAAEVTSQLKARIEQMKARQGFNRP